MAVVPDRESDLARFDKLTQRAENGCVEWIGRKMNTGYGWFNFGSHHLGAHHAALLLAGIERPPGAHCLHRCDNRACVNPDHLWWGTRQENMDDMVAKGRHVVNRQPRVTRRPYGKAKLRLQDVHDIRQSSARSGELAALYGVRRNTIQDIRARRTWAAA